MLSLIYAFVILVATTLGAFVGLGGGVIIKPVLDFIGAEPRMQVDFLSAAAVFTMSVVSTGKSIKNKVFCPFNWKTDCNHDDCNKHS